MAVVLLTVLHAPAAFAQAQAVVFLASGVPQLVREEGEAWKRGDGFLECGGVNNYLWAGKSLGAGDFHVKARLTVSNLAKSAASFVLDRGSHFGFEGGHGEVFVEGPVFGKSRALGKIDQFVQAGKPFALEVVRRGTDLTVLIDGKQVHTQQVSTGPLGMFGFRPWRSTMKITEFSAEGNLEPLPPPRSQPTSYSIPILDLSSEAWRQVVIARGTADVYQGHPTTLLMPDGKTMFAVWTYDHGGACGPLKKSTDGGLTWGDLLPVPDNWKSVRNCPAIHRLVDPAGVARLFVFAGNGDLYQSVSEDDGASWSPMAKNGLHCVVVPSTIEPLSGNRYLALYHQRKAIYQSVSSDGGLTWESEREICRLAGTYPGEPALIRSPDGKQLAALCRENNRVLNSLLITSDDEGETWSAPRELPASLTGDRHLPRYAPDGRIVCPFRDMADGSPTKGDFVAWVGTYGEIVTLREGQYRVRLLDSPVKVDLGYPGLEVLPDGTLAATTYAVLKPGEKNSVVSVRFTMAELDAKAAQLPQQEAVFTSGKEGYHTFRIPSLLVTKKGTVLAFCEGRKTSADDHGDLDLVLKRSADGGNTWGPLQVVYEEGGAAPVTLGNPCPVVDQNTGTIWLTFCRDNKEVLVTSSIDDGLTWSKPVDLTKEVKSPDWGWYATGPGVGIQLRHGPHAGRLVIPCDHREKDDGEWIMHSHVFLSDDAGKTWRLGGSADKHTDECQVVELTDGTLLLNMRNYWGTTGKQPERGNRRALARSKDGGATWSALQFDDTLVEPICQASLIRHDTADGKVLLLFSNPANTGRVELTIRASLDEGRTWPRAQVLNHGPSAYSCLAVLPDGQLGCLYERGEKNASETITFARCGLDWLVPTRDR